VRPQTPDNLIKRLQELERRLSAVERGSQSIITGEEITNAASHIFANLDPNAIAYKIDFNLTLDNLSNTNTASPHIRPNSLSQASRHEDLTQEWLGYDGSAHQTGSNSPTTNRSFSWLELGALTRRMYQGYLRVETKATSGIAINRYVRGNFSEHRSGDQSYRYEQKTIGWWNNVTTPIESLEIHFDGALATGVLGLQQLYK
jgi:hypothetical protein